MSLSPVLRCFFRSSLARITVAVVWPSMMVVLGTQVIAGPSTAQATEPAAVITEIELREGQAEVKRARLPAWRPAAPLLTLEAGDTVRTSGDAAVAILLTGRRGTVKVDATNSPVVVPSADLPADQSKVARGWILLEESVEALLKASNDIGQTTLGSRGHASSTVILTPRNGPVLPDSVMFEWLGRRDSRYTIRVIGPSGLVFERKDLAGMKVMYPPGAAPLTAGARYHVQIAAGGELPQEAWFEVVDPVRAETIRRDLAELAAAAGPMLSPNTLVAVRAGYLANQGLLADSRRRLVVALDNQPGEATFHVLLGDIYERLGLPEQAAESFAKARLLVQGHTERGG